MKAMILAAGLGTRLRPLTNDRPKPLVEFEGKTLLERVIDRLKAFGIRDVIINVHHFATMVVEYLEANQGFGINIAVSREQTLLDTGGGLKQAAWFFDNEPFLVHNVDVFSNIDFQRMLEFHRRNEAVATLAVHDRRTSRYLLFDDRLQLCGRSADPSESPKSLAFSGIHIVSPRLFKLLSEEGAFSIINAYLRLAAAGERVAGFPADAYQWRDLGTLNALRSSAEG
jgi:NDP-sugar pyrophosphorylase family protein